MDGDGEPRRRARQRRPLPDPAIADPSSNGANYVTIVSTTPVPATNAPAPLATVSIAPQPATPPPSTGTPQTSLISFSADYRDPADPEAPVDQNNPIIGTFVVYLPQEANEYWKYDAATDTWTDASTLVAFDAAPTTVGGVQRWRAVITIVDGGFGDDDGIINGQIVDPGVFLRTERDAPVIECPAAPDITYRTAGRPSPPT